MQRILSLTNTAHNQFKFFVNLLISLLLGMGISFAQQEADSSQVMPEIPLRCYGFNRISTNKAIVINAALYGGSMSALYFAWYKNYPQSSFHVFNDDGEWLQMDKVGHAYSAYTIGRYSMEIWRATGISRKKRIWIGGLSGAAYQTVIETLDGFSSQWGWSWGDFAANVAGSGMLIAQELNWDEQRIQFKTSFHRKMYPDQELNARSNDLFGRSSFERALKDYNGQTYWLSANLHSFFPDSKFPCWLNVALGSGAEGMFGARENVSRNLQGQIVFDRRDIHRKRQWYLAPDVDFTKIKSRHKAVRALLFVANSLKFPTPALELSGGKMKLRWLVF
jgi:uncharacterized protein YfiM (DUF2279 family)